MILVEKKYVSTYTFGSGFVKLGSKQVELVKGFLL